MVNVIKQLVSQEVVNQRSYGKGNKIQYITPHQTGNMGIGANAQMHANLQSNLNARQASWHYQVDDRMAIQSFEDNVMCWAAGDGRGPGNTASIHIEMCINADGDYEQTINNGAALVKMLMDKYGLDRSRIKQHHDWSGKNCPAQLRAGYKGITWEDFLNKVDGVQEEENFGSPSPGPNQPKPKPVENGNSIVDYLNAQGIDSSFKNRAILAKQYGMNNYQGTAAQNIALLEKIKKGVPKKPQTAPKANLNVDGKWGKSTTRALQKALGTPVDGIISNQPKNSVTNAFYDGTIHFASGKQGSPMVKALQRLIGANPDGFMGPQTVRALQIYLGTVADGVLSRPSLVVKEMQRRLNAGTFVK
ncbi:N-acetylmuramoyl-L-alanine amidase [Cytobacillus kochii]|uniref:N-acetylmuramoyl-L-alanine amidase n=1 Tax=Cytobacillus kochii TaxID=859143 RepID=UPI00203FBA4D|nr:N-acetylmuramoyl-L-alanine amidase [Cytobacillus kochii]MCM3324906.1 N-acetylmuramoyl-L-alanine amidase [Cytobacillus kochii]MCM3347302.1 N-acetylmuramoyl-L-alanine amidase [Cytobacillus kochii]